MLITLFFGSRVKLCADELHIGSFLPDLYYAYTERENMRVYISERYSGLKNRERRIYLEQTGDIGSDLYEGNVYILREWKRDSVGITAPLDASIPISCIIDQNGLKSRNNETLPMRSSFPVLIEEEIEIGEICVRDLAVL